MSPAKQMDFTSPLPRETAPQYSGTDRDFGDFTQPFFADEAEKLNSLLRKYSQLSLESLMKISPALAEKTYREIHEFSVSGNPLRPALYAYSGTVFQALAKESLTSEALDFAGKHLRILSGLYGLLRPMDLIQPYRLEMKTPIRIPAEGSLSAFWKSRITGMLLAPKEAGEILHGPAPCPWVINLGSGEYTAALETGRLAGRLLNFHFKERSGGKLRTVGTYAKIARGLMIRRILDERTVDPEVLKNGETGGYRYSREAGGDFDWVFVRN